MHFNIRNMSSLYQWTLIICRVHYDVTSYWRCCWMGLRNFSAFTADNLKIPSTLSPTTLSLQPPTISSYVRWEFWVSIAIKTTCSVHWSAYIVSNLNKQPWPGWVRYNLQRHNESICALISVHAITEKSNPSKRKLETKCVEDTVFVILSYPPYKEEVSGSQRFFLNLYLIDIMKDIVVFLDRKVFSLVSFFAFSSLKRNHSFI